MSIYTIWRFNKHTHRFYTMDLQLDNIVGDIQATKDVVEIFAGGDEVDSGAAATSVVTADEMAAPEITPNRGDSLIRFMIPSPTKVFFSRTQQSSGLHHLRDDDGKVIATAGLNWGSSLMMKVVFGEEGSSDNGLETLQYFGEGIIFLACDLSQRPIQSVDKELNQEPWKFVFGKITAGVDGTTNHLQLSTSVDSITILDIKEAYAYLESRKTGWLLMMNPLYYLKRILIII
jgi:hypothetical protein